MGEIRSRDQNINMLFGVEVGWPCAPTRSAYICYTWISLRNICFKNEHLNFTHCNLSKLTIVIWTIVYTRSAYICYTWISLRNICPKNEHLNYTYCNLSKLKIIIWTIVYPATRVKLLWKCVCIYRIAMCPGGKQVKSPLTKAPRWKVRLG